MRRNLQVSPGYNQYPRQHIGDEATLRRLLTYSMRFTGKQHVLYRSTYIAAGLGVQQAFDAYNALTWIARDDNTAVQESLSAALSGITAAAMAHDTENYGHFMRCDEECFSS